MIDGLVRPPRLPAPLARWGYIFSPETGRFSHYCFSSRSYKDKPNTSEPIFLLAQYTYLQGVDGKTKAQITSNLVEDTTREDFFFSAKPPGQKYTIAGQLSELRGWFKQHGVERERLLFGLQENELVLLSLKNKARDQWERFEKKHGFGLKSRGFFANDQSRSLFTLSPPINIDKDRTKKLRQQVFSWVARRNDYYRYYHRLCWDTELVKAFEELRKRL